MAERLARSSASFQCANTGKTLRRKVISCPQREALDRDNACLSEGGLNSVPQSQYFPVSEMVVNYKHNAAIHRPQAAAKRSLGHLATWGPVCGVGAGADPSCILLTCIMDSRACLPLCSPCGAGVGIALTGHCSSLRSPFALILVGLLIYFFGGATRSMKKTSAPSTL